MDWRKGPVKTGRCRVYDVMDRPICVCYSEEYADLIIRAVKALGQTIAVKALGQTISRKIRLVGVRDLKVPSSNTPMAVRSEAPHYQVFGYSHSSDIARLAKALQKMIKGMNPRSVLDLMAGCGVTAAILSTTFPEASLIVNDLDPMCAHQLPINFPTATVFNKDIKTWDFPSADLISIDFNRFTLNRLGKWTRTLARAGKRCKTLLFVDSACYGFHMGNLSSYGVDSPMGYYQMLSDILYEITDKRICNVVICGGAALVKMTDGQPNEIELTTETELMQIIEVPKGGLFENE